MQNMQTNFGCFPHSYFKCLHKVNLLLYSLLQEWQCNNGRGFNTFVATKPGGTVRPAKILCLQSETKYKQGKKFATKKN